jgi:hypothetical protein
MKKVKTINDIPFEEMSKVAELYRIGETLKANILLEGILLNVSDVKDFEVHMLRKKLNTFIGTNERLYKDRPIWG